MCGLCHVRLLDLKRIEKNCPQFLAQEIKEELPYTEKTECDYDGILDRL